MRLPLLPRELHTSGRPSVTAQWTTLGRALELERPAAERIVTDPFAPYFLTDRTAQVLNALRTCGELVRFAERSRFAGIATSSLCRHRFIDTQLLQALPEVEQLLILGAGYDSRAYRFRRSIAGRPVYEVDLAPISRRKAAIIAAHRAAFGNATVRRVEIDFRTQSLTEQLMAAGFCTSAPTFVAWEGVAMYLTRHAVTTTLEALAELCDTGSLLAMDAWQHVGGFTVYDHVRRVGEQAIRLVGEPITFAVDPNTLGTLLAEHGFAVREVAMSDMLERRYATGGRRCDEGLYVLAAERR